MIWNKINSDNIHHIIEPFWGGWKIYNWDKGIPGIGLNEKIVLEALRDKKKILVTIGKDPTVYEISPVTVVNQAKKYNSIFKARYGTKLAVVPQNQFRKRQDD